MNIESVSYREESEGIYYVEDDSYIGGSTGPENPDYSDTWGHEAFSDY